MSSYLWPPKPFSTCRFVWCELKPAPSNWVVDSGLYFEIFIISFYWTNLPDYITTSRYCVWWRSIERRTFNYKIGQMWFIDDGGPGVRHRASNIARYSHEFLWNIIKLNVIIIFTNGSLKEQCSYNCATQLVASRIAKRVKLSAHIVFQMVRLSNMAAQNAG